VTARMGDEGWRTCDEGWRRGRDDGGPAVAVTPRMCDEVDDRWRRVGDDGACSPLFTVEPSPPPPAAQSTGRLLFDHNWRIIDSTEE